MNNKTPLSRPRKWGGPAPACPASAPFPVRCSLSPVFLCLGLAMALALASYPADADAATSNTAGIAVVVGNNTSQTADLETLSFADDDAIKSAELLQMLGFQVTLLASPDKETIGLHPQGPYTPPTRRNLLDAVASALETAKANADSGKPLPLFFVFSGHGSYDPEGRGYLHLQDGRFTMRDLVYELAVPTKGLCNVVIVVDSCNAEFLVKTRGSALRRAQGPSTLRLEEYPHVGLALSSSATGEVREWGRYLGGVFSHQVRSAMLGGADQDCDGIVTFPELAAFLEAANQAVANPELRLQPYVRAPLAAPAMPFSAPGRARNGAWLRLDGPRPLRLAILDHNMARKADLHLASACPRQLLLPPGETLTIVEGDSEHAVERTVAPEIGTTLTLSALPVAASSGTRARGTDTYLRRNLFKVPYGSDYYGQFVAERYAESLAVERYISEPWYTNGWAWAAAGAGAAAAVTAMVFHGLANDASQQAASARWPMDIHKYNNQVDDYNMGAAISWGVTGAGLLTGIVLFIVDDRYRTESFTPEFDGPLAVMPSLGGIDIQIRY